MGNDGDRLAIPLSELEGFGGRLRSIKNRMNRTAKTFESYRDDIGDGGVVDKLEDFEGNWEDGREDIDQQLSSLAEMSDTVVREANKVDTDLEKELQKGSKKEESNVGGAQ